jgi:hypothetical protein
MKDPAPPVSDIDRQQHEAIARGLGLTLEEFYVRVQTIDSNVIGSAGNESQDSSRPRPTNRAAAPAKARNAGAAA